MDLIPRVWSRVELRHFSFPVSAWQPCFQVAVESEDDSSEEDLSQYPLATANGTFKREDFFEEGKNKKKNRKNKNEKKGEPRT